MATTESLTARLQRQARCAGFPDLTLVASGTQLKSDHPISEIAFETTLHRPGHKVQPRLRRAQVASPLFEIARVLVCFDHVASFITKPLTTQT